MGLQINSVSVRDRDFTVTTYPVQPYAGQAFMVLIDGKGPHSVASPIEEDSIDKIFIEVDFGDSEAEFPVYSYGTTFNGRTRYPNKGYGPRTGHAYKTPGTYTITVRSWAAQGSINTQTHSITVLDPDDVAWDHDYYIDLNGSSTGMPTEAGAVEHILSYAALFALSSSHTPSEKVRFNFRAGTTHTLATTGEASVLRLRAALNYVQTFGGSDNAVLEVTATTPNDTVRVFLMSNSDLSLIMRDTKIDGKYDIANGQFPQGRVDGVFSSHGNALVSAFHCDFLGVQNGLSLSNVEAEVTRFVGFIGCNAADVHNFGLAFVAEATYQVVRGCTAFAPRNQKRGDGKGATQNDFPDHAFVRLQKYEHISCEQNWLGIGGAWSALGSDLFIQPAFRIHGHQNTAPGVACIMFNDTVGGSLVQFGNHTVGNGIATTQLNRGLVVGNSHDSPLMWGIGIYTQGAGGVYAYSNVFFTPKGSVAWNSSTKRIFVQNERGSTTDDAVWELPNRIRHNTFVCDNDAGEYADVTGTDVEEWASDDVGASAWITAEYNLLSGDAFQNAGSITPMSQLARGDQFRPITGTAAATLVSDVPPINFDRTRNTTGVSQSPNGAHGVAGADASVMAPAWSSAPTIGLLTGHGTVLGVTDVSGLAGDGQIILEYNWKVDGVNVGDDRRWLPVQYLDNSTYPNVDGTQIGYSSGDSLTCEVVAVNRAGTRVSSTSNAYVVP